MRKSLMTVAAVAASLGSASAADLPARAPAYVAAPAPLALFLLVH